MRYFVPFFLAGALSVVADFTISLDGLTQVPFMSVIDFPSGVDAVTQCQSNCSSPIQQMQACNAAAADATCFCTLALQTSLGDCEQCMLNSVVAANIKQPSPIVGSNPVMAGLFGACSGALPKVGLGLPPNWDGPFGLGLNGMPATIVVVGIGFLLGASAIFIFASIDLPE